MVGRRRVFGLLAIAAAVFIAPLAARAQTTGPAGTLVWHLYQDEPIPVLDSDSAITAGKTEPLEETCRVYVLPDMSEQRVPDAINSLDQTDPPLPIIATRPVDSTGFVSLSLPAGEYSVMERGCFQIVPSGPSQRECCPKLKGEPALDSLKTVSGQASFDSVQTVRINAGQTTTVVTQATFADETSRAKLLLILAILGGVLASILLVCGFWKFRPRYEPTTDPSNPVAAPEPKSRGRAANFDSVFGDFLKRKR